jgi:hypothetical protein
MFTEQPIFLPSNEGGGEYTYNTDCIEKDVSIN